jgi:uncharacterized protein YeaO (DUF488 family)
VTEWHALRSPRRADLPGASRSRFEVARVYDAPAAEGAHRVLVDRLWPRGIAKVDAPFDEWAKEVAPSSELRRWYGHEPERFQEFALRYKDELEREAAREAIARLRGVAKRKRVVLVTATGDVEHSGAAVLRDVFSK